VDVGSFHILIHWYNVLNKVNLFKYMFGNGTLVDLLRFDKVVQARTKVPSKGPVRCAGDWNRRSGTSLGSIGAARAHLRAQHAHWASSARPPATRFGNLKLSNTFSIDARQALETPSTCARTKIIRPAFRLALQGFTSEGFHPENLQSNLPSHPKRI